MRRRSDDDVQPDGDLIGEEAHDDVIVMVMEP